MTAVPPEFGEEVPGTRYYRAGKEISEADAVRLLAEGTANPTKGTRVILRAGDELPFRVMAVVHPGCYEAVVKPDAIGLDGLTPVQAMTAGSLLLSASLLARDANVKLTERKVVDEGLSDDPRHVARWPEVLWP